MLVWLFETIIGFALLFIIIAMWVATIRGMK